MLDDLAEGCVWGERTEHAVIDADRCGPVARGGVGFRQVHVQAEVARVELDRATGMPNRGGGVVGGEELGEVGMGLPVVRVERENALKGVDGRAVVASDGEDLTEALEGFDVFGLQLDGLFQGGAGGGGLTGGEEGAAVGELGSEVVGAFGRRGGELFEFGGGLLGCAADEVAEDGARVAVGGAEE